jgi:hypothetical protein
VPQPGDAQFGTWTYEQLERMDAEFVWTVERAIEHGQESAAAAAATYDPRRRSAPLTGCKMPATPAD